MNYTFYRLTCLTNLHMGSGDVNYNVVDLEVERDPVTGEPTMNSTGVKGALRDFCEAKRGCAADPDSDPVVRKLFGTRKGGANQGSCVFCAGDLLARPVRITGAGCSYVLAATPDLLVSAAEKLRAFGIANVPNITVPPLKDENTVLSTVSVGKGNIEGYQVKTVPADAGIAALLGTEHYAVLSADQLKSISLPVLAHNVLDNGTSKNLWYEEYVPHHSVFGLLIGSPDASLNGILGETPVVQFGAEATTGCGYMRMEEVAFHE